MMTHLIKDTKSFGCLLLLAVMLTNCTGTGPAEGDTVLARVGSERLTVEDARNHIPGFMYRQDSVSAINRYRNEWIQKRILLQEANRIDLSGKESVRKQLQKAREEVLTESLKDHVLKDLEVELQVNDEEARSYYQANKNQFILNEKFVRFRHLETGDLSSARSARRDLMQAVEWPEVAQKYSVDPEVAIRQSEQFWPISMAVNELDILNRYLNIIGNMEISPIERINGNYHFVQLIDTRAEGEHPDLEWLIEEIKDWLLIRKKNRHFSSYVKNLYLKAESNNEVETFNVFQSQNNRNSVISDTLETDSNNE